MITLRPAHERGHARHGWLDSHHSFSFASYHDPRHMGFGPLRVINEDRIAPGSGFGEHGHRDMEIISYVLSGALAHQDSMGNRTRIVPGEVQRMSAGTGVLHAEYNADPGQTHFLQIWIQPQQTGLPPSYAQRAFDPAERRGRLRVLVSPDGREDSLTMAQDALLLGGLFDGADTATYGLAPGRLGYVYLARGRLQVNGQALQAGDALLLRDEPALQLAAGEGAEVLVFDLPARSA